MLPSSWRLSRPNFIHVKKTGKSYRTPHYSYIVIHNSMGHNRYSVVISARLSKLAVIRNRLRRFIYSSVSALSGHCDIIIYPNSSMLKLTHAEISALLNSSLPQPTSA